MPSVSISQTLSPSCTTTQIQTLLAIGLIFRALKIYVQPSIWQAYWLNLGSALLSLCVNEEHRICTMLT